MKKNIFLIIGSNHPAALELIYSRELTELGISNIVLGVQNTFLEFYKKSILNKLLFRIGLSNIYAKIQKEIKVAVFKINPQVVIVFKGMEVTPRTLKWLKKKDIKLVNYNPDSPFIFSGRGSGNKNVRKSINLYDYYFTYDEIIKEGLKKRGVKSELIPFGFDNNGFVFREIKREEEVIKLCFLGNADKFRLNFLKELAKRGIKIDVYGENWAKLKLHKNICVFGPQYGEEFWKTLQKYAIQLNLLRTHNWYSHNMRSFDIPGAGGIMLAQITQDHQTYFKSESEVFLFADIDEALVKINYLLNLEFLERNYLRNIARERALNNHTYNRRVKQIISYLEV